MATPGLSPSLELTKTNFETNLESLGLYSPGALPPTGVLRDQRRGRQLGTRSNAGEISLIERDGMLFWDVSPLPPPLPAGMRRLRRRSLLGRLIARREFLALGQNEIGLYLSNLDQELTPDRGLLEWSPQQGKLIPPQTKLETEGRFLLIIHGTFSRSEHIFKDLQSTQNGIELLKAAAARYKRVFAFDHPTVSVSPMLNALDLRTQLATSNADMDIICHSRGGLVSRWWMEVFDTFPARKKRTIFVASPLNGTGLASPARLRSGLNTLATFARLLGSGSMAIPLLHAPAAILRVLASVVGVTSRVPIVDAALAMIPGLNGQSRISNNAELSRLNHPMQNTGPYFFVRSDFESSAVGWNFCKYIWEGKIRLAEAAADKLVFPSQNDLVVDTESMTEVPANTAIAAASIQDFGTNGNVHHTNYFVQPQTLAFIRTSFQF